MSMYPAAYIVCKHHIYINTSTYRCIYHVYNKFQLNVVAPRLTFEVKNAPFFVFFFFFLFDLILTATVSYFSSGTSEKKNVSLDWLWSCRLPVFLSLSDVFKVDDIALNYRDPDGDLIRILDDEDVQLMIKEARGQQGKVKRPVNQFPWELHVTMASDFSVYSSEGWERKTNAEIYLVVSYHKNIEICIVANVFCCLHLFLPVSINGPYISLCIKPVCYSFASIFPFFFFIFSLKFLLL